MRAAVGRRIMFLNDDARPARDVLRLADDLFDRDPDIGCIGCRAIEDGYANWGEGIGRIESSGEIVANFNVDCGQPIEVEHLYGFCYVFTRQAFNRVGVNDETLLAKPYSSGDRIETDHCLRIRESGLKVIYHPRMTARHLAKPRADMSEISLRWKLNSIRNTIYLFLKHYGLFGKGGAALRLTFIVDIGLLSMLRRPTWSNAAYFLNGLRARTSAYGHYLLYLLRAGKRRAAKSASGTGGNEPLEIVSYSK
jgi:GT2 family glycosyltransferase